jgi:hypothetical protein
MIKIEIEIMNKWREKIRKQKTKIKWRNKK